MHDAEAQLRSTLRIPCCGTVRGVAREVIDCWREELKSAGVTADLSPLCADDLLTDRFHLTAHHETRELSVLAIVQSKSGPELTKTKRPPGGIPTVGYSPGHLGAGNATIADFASFLQRFVTDRPVVDQTGIVGKYDFDLKWTPDETQTETGRQSSESSNPLPGLYTAIQEQLGLKLQQERLPAQVFVIDHVDTPSEN